MLWLALYFPDLPLEVFAHAQAPTAPVAVSQSLGGREQIARCNQVAQAVGVQVGMSLPSALALASNLRVYARDRRIERGALEQLASWAYQFSPQISFEPSLLLLEVAGSLRLFGGLPKLMQRLLRESSGLGYRVQWAAAPTPMAAGLLARRNLAQACIGANWTQALKAVPLRALTREPGVRRLIADIGLQSIGDCLQLPRPELARRVGPVPLLLLDRLLGDAADPRPFWEPPAVFVQRMELAAEIHQHTALVFPARRLITALCGFLRGRGAAAQSLQWQLQHREHRRSDFTQGLLQPSRDAEHILALFRERIERVSLSEPVMGLALRVDDCLPYAEQIGQLLDGAVQRDDSLLEKLRSRLGEHQVSGLCSLPDYRPEKAWEYCLPGASTTFAAALPDAPPWLLREPRPLHVEQGRPVYGGPLQLPGRSRRVECGWWDGFDVARDYFVALSWAGERLWVFRDRRSGRWFLHGLFG